MGVRRGGVLWEVTVIWVSGGGCHVRGDGHMGVRRGLSCARWVSGRGVMCKMSVMWVSGGGVMCKVGAMYKVSVR